MEFIDELGGCISNETVGIETRTRCEELKIISVIEFLIKESHN